MAISQEVVSFEHFCNANLKTCPRGAIISQTVQYVQRYVSLSHTELRNAGNFETNGNLTKFLKLSCI